jgi:ornithine cyclodeaminase/alanine dehydrogenase-like protein (mu-crystallin family)
MPLWLSERDVRQALAMPALIDAMEEALARFSAGAVAQPVRTAIELRPRCFFGVMPAFDADRGILGCKLVTVVPPNGARGLPTHQAAIALFDAETGSLEAVLDGRYITEARTAAVSAVSLRHLARPDADVLAILGSGVQARSHLEAFRHVRRFRQVRAWSPTAEHLRRFAEETGLEPADSAEAAVRGAGVVLAATDSVSPVLDSAWVADGAHVIAIGACRPSQRELDPALVARAALFVDSKAAALVESGDVVQPIAEGRIQAAHILAELGQVVSGAAPGRRGVEEVTLFKSWGLAIEDLAAAALAWRSAKAAGVGQNLALGLI